jgi:hypothetical protein
MRFKYLLLFLNLCFLPCLSVAQNHLTFTGQPLTTPVGQTIPPVHVQIQDAGGNVQTGASATIVVRLNFTPTLIPFSQLSVASVDSEETVCQTSPATYAIDGNTGTYWHTAYCSAIPAHPHTLTVNLSASVPIIGFRELARQDAPNVNGRIAGYTFEVSPTGVQWDAPLAQGTLQNNATEQQITAESATVPLAWDYNTTPPLQQTGFVIGRCTVVSPATTCSNFADLANGTTGPTTLTYLDYLVTPGTSYCYQVQAMDATTRSAAVVLCRSVGPKIASQARLVATSEVNGGPWTSVAELGVMQGVLLNGTRTKATASGTADWTDLNITTPGTYNLTAFAPGFTPITSASFTITSAANVATHLGFEVQPTASVIGQTMQPVIVRVLDAAENLVTSTAADVTLTITGGVTPPPLQGTTTVAAVSGRATLSAVVLPPTLLPGTYNLVASSAGLTGALSAPFIASVLQAPTSVQWRATRSSRILCSQTGGDGNDAAVQGTAEHAHSLTCTVPANTLSVGSTIRACMLLRAQMGSTSPGWSLAFLADDVRLVGNVPRVAAIDADATSWVCMQLQSHGPPSGVVLTSSSLETYFPTGMLRTGRPFASVVPQPVLLASNAPLALRGTTTWAGSGAGTNILTQHAFFVELLR